jgi:hypothetical protein
VVASLAALFVISVTSSGMAASAGQRANVSYASSNYASSNASQVSRTQEPVPANCIRQECGKLWCWQMKGSSR